MTAPVSSRRGSSGVHATSHQPATQDLCAEDSRIFRPHEKRFRFSTLDERSL